MIGICVAQSRRLSSAKKNQTTKKMVRYRSVAKRKSCAILVGGYGGLHLDEHYEAPCIYNNIPE